MEKKLKPLSIPGTKVSVQNAQLLISSGIPGLDEIVGGGFPVGTIILLEEDAHGNYARFLIKYFLAEGVACKHSLFLASRDSSTNAMLGELPSILKQKPVEDVPDRDNKEMKIAFRYKNLPQAPSTSRKEFGHYFDLSVPMSPEELQYVNVQQWKSESVSDGSYKPYDDLLQSVYKKIKEQCLFLTDSEEKDSILRVALHSIGSPCWRSDDSNVDNQNLQKFFISLRALMRSAYSVALVTIPSTLLNKNILDKCLNCSDMCLRLHSFSGTELENNSSLSKYHGFFYVDKIAAINSLTSKYQGPVDYAFKLLRRKFCIELLHLPPAILPPMCKLVRLFCSMVSVQSGSWKNWAVVTDVDFLEFLLPLAEFIDKSPDYYDQLHPSLGTVLLTSTHRKWHRRRSARAAENFLEEQSAPQHRYIPFSGGPRNCVGKFAPLAMLSFILCNLKPRICYFRECHLFLANRGQKMPLVAQSLLRLANGITVVM